MQNFGFIDINDMVQACKIADRAHKDRVHEDDHDDVAAHPFLMREEVQWALNKVSGKSGSPKYTDADIAWMLEAFGIK